MNGSPLVSVVIPVYNGERFVAQAIDSVLAQTMTNHEVVVVNDGSTDGTAGLLASYGDRIRVHHQKNGGVASARNAGVRAARSGFIAFLDADDVWLPEKLERQMPLLGDDDVALVYSGIQVVDAELRPMFVARSPDPADVLRNTLDVQPPPVPLTMTGVVRRSAFDAIGGFDERLSTSADADFVCRIAVRYKLARVDEPLALYRQHSAQMHLNVAAMERDMTLLHAKFFSDPAAAAYARHRTRAAASLQFALALGYASQNQRGAAVRHALGSLRAHPLRFIRLLVDYAVRRSRDDK
ncbi:MAG: glycosyltransferase [Acidobacteriota bacterium]|nr:glycosyltransferase [Acidobacteriota bacterium]